MGATNPGKCPTLPSEMRVGVAAVKCDPSITPMSIDASPPSSKTTQENTCKNSQLDHTMIITNGQRCSCPRQQSGCGVCHCTSIRCRPATGHERAQQSSSETRNGTRHLS